MSTLISDGSHVDEIFASKLKSLVNKLAINNEHVNFHLNQQDAITIHLSCDHAFAYEYLTFIDALDSEILAYGVAIVVATHYMGDKTENTIFVVCDDEL